MNVMELFPRATCLSFIAEILLSSWVSPNVRAAEIEGALEAFALVALRACQSHRICLLPIADAGAQSNMKLIKPTPRATGKSPCFHAWRA